MISGVSGGRGEHFGVDATLVRIAIVVATIVTGGIVALRYVGAWLVLPEGPVVVPTSNAIGEETTERPRHWRGRRSGAGGLVWGVLLIAAGALLLARRADVALPARATARSPSGSWRSSVWRTSMTRTGTPSAS